VYSLSWRHRGLGGNLWCCPPLNSSPRCPESNHTGYSAITAEYAQNSVHSMCKTLIVLQSLSPALVLARSWLRRSPHSNACSRGLRPTVRHWKDEHTIRQARPLTVYAGQLSRRFANVTISGPIRSIGFATTSRLGGLCRPDSLWTGPAKLAPIAARSLNGHGRQRAGRRSATKQGYAHRFVSAWRREEIVQGAVCLHRTVTQVDLFAGADGWEAVSARRLLI